MRLPVMPPLQPMLAKSVKGIPDPAKFGGLSFEPKWDDLRFLLNGGKWIDLFQDTMQRKGLTRCSCSSAHQLDQRAS